MADPNVPAISAPIRTALEEIRSSRRVPGMAIGIVDGGKLSAFTGLGVLNTETKESPTADSIFRVASITKTITGTALLQLRDAGKLDLDDPIRRHLPEFNAVRIRRGSLDQVTLRRLLSHHAGLSSESPHNYWDSYKFPSIAEIIASLGNAEIVLEADTAFKYSNLAFALLGEVVARITRCTYTQYVQANILTPLGMTSSSFTLDSASQSRLATGYEPNPDTDTLRQAPYPDLHGLTAAGQLYSCVRDLARWIGFQLQSVPGQTTETQVLAPASLDEMHRPYDLNADWSAGYGLAWIPVRRGDVVYHGHTGTLPGYRSAIYFNKPSKLGAVVLSNLSWIDGAIQAALKVLELSKVHRPKRPDLNQQLPASVSSIVGVYARRGVNELRLVYRDNRLHLEAYDPNYESLFTEGRLDPTADPAIFEVVGGRGAGEFARFETNQGGDAIRFTLAGAVYKQIVSVV